MPRTRRETAETTTTTPPDKARAGDRATPGPAQEEKRANRPTRNQKDARKRVRVSRGVYRDQYGLAATVKVNGMQRECRFPRGTPLRTIQAWRDDPARNPGFLRRAEVDEVLLRCPSVPSAPRPAIS